MLPIKHIAVSAPLAVTLGWLTESLWAGMLCFFSGFLVDLDHMLEYLLYYGLKDVRPKKVYHACANMANWEEEGKVNRIFLVLHAAEIAIALWVGYAFTQNIYLLAAALGYSAHLIMDASANAIKPSAYFLTTRIKNGFRMVKLVRSH